MSWARVEQFWTLRDALAAEARGGRGVPVRADAGLGQALRLMFAVQRHDAPGVLAIAGSAGELLRADSALLYVSVCCLRWAAGVEAAGKEAERFLARGWSELPPRWLTDVRHLAVLHLLLGGRSPAAASTLAALPLLPSRACWWPNCGSSSQSFRDPVCADFAQDERGRRAVTEIPPGGAFVRLSANGEVDDFGVYSE